MYEKNPDIDIAAYHETGHALAALREGRRVSGILISRTDPGNGICWHAPKPRNPYPIEHNSGSAKAAWLHTLESTCAEIRIALAGPIAEAKALGTPLRSLGSRSDLESCLRLASRLPTLQSYVSHFVEVPPVDPHSILEREKRNVRRWIGRPGVWRTIQLVARVLKFRGSLSPQYLDFWIAVGLSDGKQAHFFLAETGAKQPRNQNSASRTKVMKINHRVRNEWGRNARAD